MVEHLAKEPLDPRAMPRKLTIYLEGPPTDGLRVAQDHFKEYVKPILVSSGLDWEFVQGRKEGDIRAELAERIRKFRMPADEVEDDDDPTTRIRRQNGISEFNGPQGDIVIGRHTWKEYIRGLHEGWLGPLKDPTPPEPEKLLEETLPTGTSESEKKIETLPGITIHSSPETTEQKPVVTDPATETPVDKSKKPPQPLPFISTAAYEAAPSPSNLPASFDPSVPIPFPHILGFANTPLRLYRFLNRRHLADNIGRETAAIVLSQYRPYHATSNATGSSFASSSDYSAEVVNDDPQLTEQATALAEEEKDWHKAVHKHTENERERTWIEEVVLDPRIATRMQKAELSKNDEDRAARIVVPEEEIEGWIKGSIRSLWRTGASYIGLGPERTTTTPDLGVETPE